jgi:hypothetical protein
MFGVMITPGSYSLPRLPYPIHGTIQAGAEPRTALPGGPQRAPTHALRVTTTSADINALYLATSHVPRRIRELVNHLAQRLGERIEA